MQPKEVHEACVFVQISLGMENINSIQRLKHSFIYLHLSPFCPFFQIKFDMNPF